MKLFPADLGVKRQTALILRRGGHRRKNTAGDIASPPRLGWVDRLWSRGGEADPEGAAVALAAMRGRAWILCLLSLLPLPWVPFAIDGLRYSPAPLLFFALSAAWTTHCLLVWPHALFRRQLRRLQEEPVTPGEVAALMPGSYDELERAFLTLAMDVTRQEVAPGAEIDLRAALRALGDAIDRLPATRVVGDSPDILTEVLRRTAGEALKSAQEEPDRVVAASLVRRAEALQRRADATHRAGLLVRRFAALRQEMAAETEALRAGLSAYYTGAHDIADLTQLAGDIRRVAAEAAAITAAREEVDDISAGSAPYLVPPVPDLTESSLRLQQGR